MRIKNCSFTGHRPEKLPWLNDETCPDCILLKSLIKEKLVLFILKGTDTFFTGMARGADTYCAELVLELKKEYPHIRLVALVPHVGQEKSWVETDQQRYQFILSQCDKIKVLSDSYTKYCMFKRNDALVQEADVLFAILGDNVKGGTLYTLKKAQSSNKNILLLNPHSKRTYVYQKK